MTTTTSRRDRYGLPLTTTADAADAYDRALVAVLRVQAGADRALRAAVRLDPDFVLGHAALALLGHEFGADVDAAGALRRATAAAQGRSCSDRERSLVAAITHRVTSPGPLGAQALLRHIADYPRDALAVSAAVPTIAFAGVYDIPERAWGLVEGLAPAYGDDWWYASLLSFTRQEQERWADAAELADRALSVEPAAGHAVHARAHVHFETGDHTNGLAWLDRWLVASGPQAFHGAHFSWHAALHELALGDDVAVQRRYAAQLAPPRVRGTRALIDSASLLWRCALEDAWIGPVPIGPVLAAAGRELIEAPPTAFVALHAAVALAAADDAAGLAQLHCRAAADRRPHYRNAIAPLAAGLQAFVEDRFDAAASHLSQAEPAVARIGGSAAQREVVSDTRLHALLAAGRLPEAQAVLERRLDRRPSRRDLVQLTRLHAGGARAQARGSAAQGAAQASLLS